jgi:pimeloyl-ACP methyl ester carboxylesterase
MRTNASGSTMNGGGSSSARRASALLALASLTAACSGDVAMVPQAGAAAGGAAPSVVAIDRSALENVGTDPLLDYADPRLWLCRPGNSPDECDANLDATELMPDGSRLVVPHVKAAEPAIDCFYVYPTVKLSSDGPMTDFKNISITLDPLLGQAARFNRVCRMYAPLYRQMGVVPGAGGAPTPGMSTVNLGLGDVRAAFKYYLDHLNQGRKVVLMGHSQGTGMLTAMMAQDVDPVPAVREKLLSAVLLGGGIQVPIGAKVGGTFANIPVCEMPGQTGCVIAYVSYSSDVPPTASSIFGRAAMPGQQAVCTEPAVLAGRTGQRYLGTYVRLDRINPTLSPEGFDMLPRDVSTRYLVYRDVLRGACRSTDTHSWLEISLEDTAGGVRPPPPYRSPAIEAALGLHLVDYSIELDDLIEAVRLQTLSVSG